MSFLSTLKEIESAASTVLGVATELPAVKTPADALAKKIRELIEAVEADVAEVEAVVEPSTPPVVHAHPAHHTKAAE